MSRNHARRTGLGLMLAALVMAGSAPAPAHAETAPGVNGLSFSADGQTFTATPPRLFARAEKLSPGTELRDTLWIRNTADQALAVTVAPELAGHGVVISLTPAAVIVLEPGHKQHLALTAALPAGAENSAQQQKAAVELSFHVTAALHQTALPETGMAGTALLPLALSALLGGAALAARRRTKHGAHRHAGEELS